jgi:hypothetical protein
VGHRAIGEWGRAGNFGFGRGISKLFLDFLQFLSVSDYAGARYESNSKLCFVNWVYFDYFGVGRVLW